ncbi:polysaccharide deacetylase family protein [Luminiphilus sp.]|nr:polysaccharide deacetylase family protein [Luminiphilus sp.]
MKPSNVLTVDLEDWFHVLDNQQTANAASWEKLPAMVESMTLRLLELFADHDLKATFFVLGYVARNHPELVAEIVAQGHEVGSHGDMHQLVFDQTPYEYENDVVASLEAIDRAAGRPTKLYRAPGFSINEKCLWAFEVLSKNGIEVDCSVFPSRRAHGGMSDFVHAAPCVLKLGLNQSLKELPISTISILGKSVVYCGGGYFRLLPYWVIDACIRKNSYNMTYFHPRDFEPAQPNIPGLGMLRTFKSSVGLSGAENKLKRVLDSHKFITVGEMIESVDWNAAPTVSFS